MPTVGPVRAAVYESIAAPGALPWSAPTNAGASDDAWTFVDFTIAVVDEETEGLRATDVPFLLEPDDTVTGLEVAVERSEVGSDVRDLSVRLVYQGAAIGPEKAASGEWPAADAVATYTWSQSELAAAGVTPAVANDVTFGVQIAATSQSGTAPRAQVDDITFSLSFTAAMTSTPSGTKLRDRVRELMRLTDRGHDPIDIVEVDNAIAECYLSVAAMLPAPVMVIEDAVTITEGSNEFALPTSHADRASALQYAGEVRLTRAADHIPLEPVTVEELDRMREFTASGLRGAPRKVALWEEADGTVRGRCFPRADRDTSLHLHCTIVVDDLRDFPDFDAALTAAPRDLSTAVVYRAASWLATRLSSIELTRLGLDRGTVREWDALSDAAVYRVGSKRHDLHDVGRIERVVV